MLLLRSVYQLAVQRTPFACLMAHVPLEPLLHLGIIKVLQAANPLLLQPHQNSEPQANLRI